MCTPLSLMHFEAAKHLKGNPVTPLEIFTTGPFLSDLSAVSMETTAAVALHHGTHRGKINIYSKKS